MTPEQLESILDEYIDGELSDDMLCAKHGLTPDQLEQIVYIGRGTPIMPISVERGMTRGKGQTVRIGQVVSGVLEPKEMALSPLETIDTLQPNQREAALQLADSELQFANCVHRGLPPTQAAAACFELYDKRLATRKGAELMKSERVLSYLDTLSDRGLMAPIRNKAYLEAVLWSAIDKSRALSQVYDMLGQPIKGRCEYNYKAVIAASALLARLKGWDNPTFGDNNTETQRDRLRRIMATQGSNADE